MLKKLLIFVIIFLYFTNVASALTIFDDSFDILDNSKWNFNKQDGSIVTDGGILKLRSSGYNFPIIYSKSDTFFSSQINVVFEAKFKFIGTTPMGNGISIGFTGSNGWPYYQFSIWNDSTSGMMFTYNNFNTLNYNFCEIGVPDDNRLGFISKKTNLDNNNWHTFRIEKNNTQYNIFFDKNENPTPIVSTLQNQCIPKNIFIGNPMGGGMTSWTSIDLDYIKIGDGEWGEEKVKNKIVFLPGMGGSWNEKAMVLNLVVPQSEWRMTPFITNYTSMLKGFDDNGLVKNTDYFVYNYDWRKPLATQIVDFNSYVAGLGLSGGEKIDIIGHSLGGIIGRIWTQENSAKVGKVITLASPNNGAVLTYEMWNGAKISDPFDMGTIALNVLLSLQKKNYQTPVETIRAYVPVIKDILPTFNYLKKAGNIVTPPTNDYLFDKNASITAIFDKLLAVAGFGFKTVEWINLVDRNLFDIVLNQWEQGRPGSYVRADGDATVLKKSAKFEAYRNVTVSANHGNVPNKSVNLVLTELGLGKTIAQIANANFSGAVFYMGSPATMKVNCGDGDVTDSDGFVLISNKNVANCMVKLTGVANGTYHLVMGNSNDDESWKYSEGSISIGENKNISINMVDFWYEQMLRENNSLLSTYPTNVNLKNMKTAILAKNRTNLLNYYFLFRKEKKETLITNRMVNYLEKIINIEIPSPSKTVFDKQRNLALSYKSLTNKTTLLLGRSNVYPNLWRSLNYTQGENLLVNPNYGKYVLAEKIFGMVWY